MAIVKFTIDHDKLIYGPFPQEMIKEVSEHISVEVENINMLSQKVTFTIDNKKDEDPLAIAYELGCAIQSYLDHKLFS